MRLANRAARPAFSLLEMVLALALGMLVLLALYVAFSVYLTLAQAGRDAAAEGALARSILARMGNDVAGQLGPEDPRLYTYPGANPPTWVQFNVGVYGTNKYVILSTHRVRTGPTTTQPEMPDEIPTSDLRRVCYWVVEEGSESLGLARAEIQQATGPDVDVFDPTMLPDQKKYIIAREVKSLQLEYYDGSAGSWKTEWDGTMTDGDLAPPVGPPAAIRITLAFRLNKTGGPEPQGVDPPTYAHIAGLAASNSFAQP